MPGRHSLAPETSLIDQLEPVSLRFAIRVGPWWRNADRHAGLDFRPPITLVDHLVMPGTKQRAVVHRGFASAD